MTQTKSDLPQGSLYLALRLSENRGLPASGWKETETGREAEFYPLTRRGRTRLKTEVARWERLTGDVSLILDISEGGDR